MEEGENCFLSPDNSLKSLMNTHFEDHTSTYKKENNIAKIIYVDNNLQQVVDYINELKVARAINSFGPFKATGPDKLRPIVLQMSSIAFIKYLTKIYRQIINTG